jgi:hypothetical protein
MTQTHERGAVRTQGGNAAAEPVNLRKRIGSTTYVVNVRFSQTSRETMEDKLLRIIKSEVTNSA